MNKKDEIQLVPKLRFPEFKKSGKWEEKKLGELVSKVGSGTTPLGGEINYKKFGHPFIRSQNIGWGKLLLDDIVYINDIIHNQSILTEVKIEDVLLNITGASIGRSVVADIRVKGGNVNQHVCIIRTNKEILNPFFLNQYLLSDEGQNKIDSFQAGGNRQGLNFAQIRSFSIPFPSLPEQQKIADCLSSLDECISAETKKLESLRLHKKGLMQNLFPAEGESVPKLRFPEFKKSGKWEVKKLGDMCKLNPPSEELPDIFIYIDLESVSDGTLLQKKIIEKDKAPSRAQRLLRNGDVIFQMVRPYQRNNYLFFSNDNSRYVASTGYAQLRAFESNMYLYQYLHNDNFIKTVLSKCTGTSYPAINSSDLSEIIVGVPSLPEQQKIADCLSSLDECITSQSHKIASLKLHKKGLMQQLFPSMEDGN